MLTGVWTVKTRFEHNDHTILASYRRFDAALQWWKLAGVDYDFSDDAANWLKSADDNTVIAGAPEHSQPMAKNSQELVEDAPASATAKRLDLLGDAPPSSLEEFREFWLLSEGLDAIGPRGRVPPRGPKNAELMVLVIDPEAGDSDKLLSGAQGTLLGQIISAMGISVPSIYFASTLTRHTPMADTAAIAAGGMDAVTAHHIALAAPKRVLAFGANIPPLLGHASTKDITSLREINQNRSSTPLMVSEGLDSLSTMPRLKARFWRRWIEWSSDQ